MTNTKNLKEPKRMSWQEIAITLFSAMLTSVLCATVFYYQVCAGSAWLESKFVPIEPCVLNAIISAVFGCMGYFLGTLISNSPSTNEAQFNDSGLRTKETAVSESSKETTSIE